MRCLSLHFSFQKTSILTLFFCLSFCFTFSQPTLKVIVAGLNHDHVHNILHAHKEGRVAIIGIAEPNHDLWKKFGKQYQLPDSLFGDDLAAMLARKKPDAVLGYNEVANHVTVVKICAPLHIPVMVEKPLAATLGQANEIQNLAQQYQIPVLTNYETTWYPSYHDVYNTIQQDSIGNIKKMVFHDGHQGPKEIGCSQQFLAWLTDPVLNGAGALNDFGCYGADLMTWLMKGKQPKAVTAVTRHYKTDVYPKVDDDATIVVEYDSATGLIEGSWNWPYSIKDMEVFGETGYLHAFDAVNISSRKREKILGTKQAGDLAAPMNDPIRYLSAVLTGELKGVDDLSSLNYNMTVMKILDAAKRSAATGKRIIL